VNTTDDFLSDYEILLRQAASRLENGRPRARTRPLRAVAAVAVVTAVVLFISTRTPDRPLPQPVASFSVFERSRAASDSVPAERVAQLSEDAAVRGLRWSEARRAIVAHGFAAYLVPARDEICLLADGRSGAGLACAPVAAAARGELSLRIADGEATTTVGVMPDGVSTVTVTGGPPARVRGNAFVVPSGAGPGRLSWTDAAGEHTTDLPPNPLSAGGR
jgi:hypothetical protein